MYMPTLTYLTMKHQISVWQQELCTFPNYSPHPESEEKKTKSGSCRSLNKKVPDLKVR